MQHLTAEAHESEWISATAALAQYNLPAFVWEELYEHLQGK